MEKTKEKILSNIAKAVNSAPDKQQYFLGLAEGMALMAESAGVFFVRNIRPASFEPII